MTTCKEIRDVVLESALTEAPASPELRQHLEGCAGCRQEYDGMRKTMALLDAWQAPEPSPFFDTRLNARLRAEAAAPQGLLQRLQAAIAGLRERPLGWRPLTAMAMVVAMAVGIGVYQHEAANVAKTPETACAVVDLQSLDNNQQLLSELNMLDDSDNSDQAQ